MFCGIGIHNTKTYESTCKLMAKQVERKRENKTLIKYWKFSFTASCPGLLELPRHRHGQRHQLAGEGEHTPGRGVQPLQVSKILSTETCNQQHQFLFSYKFNDTLYQESKTLKIVIRMFIDFDLINKFSIPYKVRPI